MWRRYIPILAAVALLAAACGDDDSVFTQGGFTTAGNGGETSTTAATTTSGLAGSDQAIADQIAEGLLAGGGGEGTLPLDAESAQCVGEGLVGVLGASRLIELGVGGESDPSAAFDQLTEGEIGAVLPVVLDCVDVHTLIVDQMTASGISPQSATCVADAFTQGSVLEDLIAAVLAGGETAEPDPAVVSQLLTVVMGCLTPEEMANLGSFDLGG